MATIRKLKGGRTYTVRFQYKGKDVWRNTGERRKELAEKKAKEIIAQHKGEADAQNALADAIILFAKNSNDEEAGNAALHSSIDALRDGLNDLLKHLPDAERERKRKEVTRDLSHCSAERLKLNDAWQAWRDSPRKRNPSDSTINGYHTQWTRFAKWAAAVPITFVHEVTPAIAEDYASDLMKAKYAPGTYNSHLTFIRSLFNVLTRRAGLPMNPWDGLPLKELERESHREFLPDELKKICKNATGDLRYMIAVGLYSGLRLKDVVHLRWDCFDWNQKMFRVMPAKTARKRKVITIPLHPVLEAMLLELRGRGDDAYVFPEIVKSYQRDPSSVSRVIQNFFKACGIQTNEESTTGNRLKAITRVGFHSLRHSFVSLCAANRVPQVAVMELVGHGSPAMTALYSHAGDEQKVRAIAVLPEISFGEENHEE